MTRPLWKTVLFRLHWLLGVTAGIVLAVQGASGALMTFRFPVLDALAHDVAPGERMADPAQWLAAAAATHPGGVAQGVVWRGPSRAVDVRVAPPAGGHAASVSVDPWRGVVLGDAPGSAFFAFVEKLHRELAAGPAGKQLTALSAIALVISLATGLVLRWPRRHTARTWLQPRVAPRGRARWWTLHSVLATWVLPVYLFLALTGLVFAYPAVRAALGVAVGAPVAPRPPPGTPMPAPVPPADLAAAIAALDAAAPDAASATLNFPREADAPLEWRVLATDAPHERAMDKLKIAPGGEVLSYERFAALPTGQQLMQSLIPLHTGTYFGVAGQLVLFLASLLMPFFLVTGLLMWRWRRVRHPVGREAPAVAAAEGA